MSYSIENTVFDVQFVYVNNRGAASVHMHLGYSLSVACTVKPVLSGHSKKKTKIGFQD